MGILRSQHGNIDPYSVMRLFNSTENKATANITLGGVKTKVEFMPFEVKTFEVNGSQLAECGMI